MKDLVKNKIFVIGLFFGLIIWGISNITLSGFTQTISGCLASGKAHGFPFTYVDECHNPTFMRINFGGLILDILLMIITCVIIGLLFKFIWSRFQAKQLK